MTGIVIKSFRSGETEKIFRRRFSKKLPQDIQVRARDLLVAINQAGALGDLRRFRLQKLAADR